MIIIDFSDLNFVDSNVIFFRYIIGYMYLFYPLLILTVIYGFLKSVMNKTSLKQFFYRIRIIVLVLLTFLSYILQSIFYKDMHVTMERKSIDYLSIYSTYDNKWIDVTDSIEQNQFIDIFKKYTVQRELKCKWNEISTSPEIQIKIGYNSNNFVYFFISDDFKKIIGQGGYCSNSFQYKIKDVNNVLFNEIQHYIERLE